MPTPRCSRRSPARSRPSCSRTRRPPRSGSRRSPRATTAGWSRSGWSPRASTCRGWPSASTPPAPSTPLFFAQAVGRFVRARRRGETASVFLPSVPNLLGFASEMEVERDHVLRRKINDEGDIFAAEDELLAQANAAEAASDEELGVVRGDGLRGALRPGALRRRRVRPRGRGARRLRRGDGLPRHPGPARGRPGPRPAALSGRASGPSCSAVPAPRPRTWSATSPPTSSWPRCAASSTAWSRRGTTAPASRTASRTPRCARTAAGRPPPSPPPTSCRAGSTGSATGPRKRTLRLIGRIGSGAWPPRRRRRWTAACGCCGRSRPPPSGLSITALAAEIGVNRTVVYRLVATLEQHGSPAATPAAGCTSGWACCAGPRAAAGAPRARRPGAALAGRAARQHRAPDRRRRRRGAGHRGRRAELDRLPRGLPGRCASPAGAGRRRPGDPARPRRGAARRTSRRWARSRPAPAASRRRCSASRGSRPRSASCRSATSTAPVRPAGRRRRGPGGPPAVLTQRVSSGWAPASTAEYDARTRR